MVMTTMVIIPAAAASSKGEPSRSARCPRGDHACPPGRVVAPGSGLERGVNYSVFYGQ